MPPTRSSLILPKTFVHLAALAPLAILVWQAWDDTLYAGMDLKKWF